MNLRVLTSIVETTPTVPHRESSSIHRHRLLLGEDSYLSTPRNGANVKLTIDAHLSGMQPVTVNAHVTDSSLAGNGPLVWYRPTDGRPANYRNVADRRTVGQETTGVR